MSERYDVVVLGGGPAGAAAAAEAATLGLGTLLIDEGRDAGGQVYRPPSGALRDESQGPGDALRQRLAESGAEARFGRRVWTVERGFRVACLGPEGPEEVETAALIVATGAQERHLPLPGWTLPGVIGLAAATILLKSEKMLPGRRTVVAGTGPLLYLVAAAILEGGGEVAAILDANSRRAWLGAMPAMLSRPDLVWRGLRWLALIRRRGVPILRRHAVTRVEGDEAVEAVVSTPLDEKGHPLPGPGTHLAADALCLGFGLLPASEVTRLLGATHRFDAEGGGWIVETDPVGTTDVPHLYACGDCTRILGAAAAPLGGRLAALAAARDLGRLDAAAFARRAAPLEREFARTARFGRAMAALARPPAGILDLMTPETILCRCEGLTRRELDRAIAAGSANLNDLKSATRCGMGPCGGRICGEAAAMLLAAGAGRRRAEIPPATARPPLRPMPLGALTGDFSYGDLPQLPPGPL